MYQHPSYNHFSEADFAEGSCSPKCSLSDMHPETMAKADKARAIAGIPFVVTSAYRSPEHDRSRGRSGTGAHTKSHALDISATDSRSRFKIVEAAIKVGFKRIGIHKSFVHLDDSPDHSQEVIWLY